MNENEKIEIYSQHSKRKTTHVSDMRMIQNPMKTFDLADKKDSLENELNNLNPEIDYVLNSHKKRKFDKIDEKPFITKIPKPAKDVNIFYSKYSNFPTLIPRFNL